MSVTLGYWNMRGLAQPIRLLLKYTNTPFKDVRYEQGDAPDYSFEEWYSIKYKMELDFPNLPYLIDGSVRLTQSNAILRHISYKNHLSGKTEDQIRKVDLMENEAYDFRKEFIKLVYDPDFEMLKDNYFKSLVGEKLRNFDKFLIGKSWFTGSEITFVDFVMFELLDQHRMCQPDVLDGYHNIKEFMERFESLPAIKEYMSSPEYITYPVNSKMATWGGKWN